MSELELINWAFSSIASGSFHDGFKVILGKAFNKLKSLKDEDKKDEFQSHLEILFEANENIKKQLEELKSGNINIKINSDNDIKIDGNDNSIKIG